MVQKKFEITLPDETQLIAEAAEGSNCPCINIYRRDNEGETDAVAFAEYNPDREYGRKLMVGAYQNNDDETRYYKNFCYVFKPSFTELYDLYKTSNSNEFKVVRDDDFIEIIRNYDGLVIYRDFSYDNDNLNHHIGDKVVLAVYSGQNGAQNISVECVDCNEVIYSVDRKTLLSDVYKIRQPRSMFDILKFSKDNDKLQSYGCIGYSIFSFGENNSLNNEWTEKTTIMRTEEFTKVYDELIDDYLRYNLLKNPITMESQCRKSDNILKIWDGEYAAQIVSDDYTFFARFIPNGKESKAYIFAYANEILYTQLEPLVLPVTADIDCEATISYIKHLDKYKYPSSSYLDNVEEECWRLFKQYAECVGVDFGDGIDFSITKEISEKIISVVEETFGVEFPKKKGE